MIVQADPQDVRFLRDMLKHAYHWRLNEDPDLPVARYVNNWGRPGDAGLIAWEAGPVGAAWYRLFPASAPGFGFVDEQTPELTIAVVPSRRGGGGGGGRPEPGGRRARRPADGCAPRAREGAGSCSSESQRRARHDEALRAFRV